MQIFSKELFWRAIGIFFIGILVPLIVEMKGKSYEMSVVFSWFYTSICWNCACMIIIFFRKKYGVYYQTKLRLLYEIPVLVLVMFFINMVLAYFIDIYVFDCPFVISERLKTVKVATIFCMLILVIYEFIYIYGQLQASVLEAQQFQTEHIKSQFEVLKSQIDPHFLFNSLNTLSAIISENQGLAVEFSENLSLVYRYILQNKDKEVVSLETELSFVESYIFLLKTRFEHSLTVNFTINKTAFNTFVPPLSLQMLVENAVKHNIISKEKPLHIEIYADNINTLFVKNNYQPKISTKNSTKIGLNNIVKRYQYLTQQPVQVLNNEQHFMVALPLL